MQRSVTRCGVSDILGESSFLNYPRAYMSVWARRQLLDLACTRARAVGCLLSSNRIARGPTQVCTHFELKPNSHREIAGGAAFIEKQACSRL